MSETTATTRQRPAIMPVPRGSAPAWFPVVNAREIMISENLSDSSGTLGMTQKVASDEIRKQASTPETQSTERGNAATQAN